MDPTLFMTMIDEDTPTSVKPTGPSELWEKKTENGGEELPVSQSLTPKEVPQK